MDQAALLQHSLQLPQGPHQEPTEISPQNPRVLGITGFYWLCTDPELV